MRLCVKWLSRCYELSRAAHDTPSSLKEIGNGAFLECYNLKEVVIPDTLGKLGRQCFYSLSHVVLSHH